MTLEAPQHARALSCLTCGYDLSGLEGDAPTCPECGRTWTVNELRNRSLPFPGELKRAWIWAITGSLLVGVTPCGVMTHWLMTGLGADVSAETLIWLLAYWTMSLLWLLPIGTLLFALLYRLSIGPMDPVLMCAWVRRLPLLATSISLGILPLTVAMYSLDSFALSVLAGTLAVALWGGIVGLVWLLTLPTPRLMSRIELAPRTKLACFIAAWVTSVGPPLLLVVTALLFGG